VKIEIASYEKFARSGCCDRQKRIKFIDEDRERFIELLGGRGTIDVEEIYF